MKIASGKFQGEMQANRPRGARLAPFLDTGGVVAQEVDRLAQFANRVERRLAGLARQKREDRAVIGLVEIRCLAQDGSTLRRRGP